jgi:hypothetical protein
VFITPESLFQSSRSRRADDSRSGAPVFSLAGHAIRALRRLKDAGFMIIAVAGEEFFQGFASPRSCREFLAATELDDVIISHVPTRTERFSNAVIQAAAKWLVDLDRSFIIGRADDITATHLTGCTPLSINTGGKARDRSKKRSLGAAVDRILAIDPLVRARPRP